MTERKISNEIENTKYMATLILMKAYSIENPHSKISEYDRIIPDIPKIDKDTDVTAKILIDKLASYGVKITPPDWLIYLIDICAGGNYGFIQLIYKELLTFINNIKYGGTGLPENYKITTTDFAMCFPKEYPILLIPKIYEKYSKLWDEQKRPKKSSLDSDNKCDTAEYWLEVIYR